MRSLPIILFLCGLVSAQTTGTLHACSTFLTTNGVLVRVYAASRVGTSAQVIQCNYASIDSLTNATCSYDAATYRIIPTGTPSGIPSDPNCYNPLPRAADAGTFLIKNNEDSVCLSAGDTATPIANGSPVYPSQCDGRHNYPLQSWTFDGSHIRQGNFCLDVTNGNTANGAKLQMWSCVEGNTNQMWNSLDSDLLGMPLNRFSWKTHPEKCVDLTNGDTTNFLQTQLWDCVQGNTNQVWVLKPAT